MSALASKASSSVARAILCELPSLRAPHCPIALVRVARAAKKPSPSPAEAPPALDLCHAYCAVLISVTAIALHSLAKTQHSATSWVDYYEQMHGMVERD